MKKRIVALLCMIGVLLYSGRVVGIQAQTGVNDKQEQEANQEVTSEYNLSKNEGLYHGKQKQKYNVVVETKVLKESLENNYSEADTVTEKKEMDDIASLSLTGDEAIKLQNQEGVIRVEKDFIITASGNPINSRKVIKKNMSKHCSWNLKAIKSFQKTEKNVSKKRNVKVAVLDSGVDFANDINVVSWVDFIPGEEEVLPLFADVTGHGSSVAGLICAQDNEKGITGINPNVDIYSAKVLDNDNEAPVSRVVSGIYWAIDNNVDIINMSFGTSNDSEILRKAICDAKNAGILLVAAAGNTGDKVEYPAAYPEVLAVGSVQSDGSLSKSSAIGKEVELVAPGEKVESTGGFGGTVVCSGTSMAAPQVVGIASLLWEKDLSVDSQFIRELLVKSANAYNNDKGYGNGLVDYEYALKIYSKLKKAFSQKGIEKRENIVEKNLSDVVVYENNCLVEGSWELESHLETVNNIVNMKYGAIYPDLSKYLSGITNHPEFHGKANYVSCILYLSMVAEHGLKYPSDIGMYLAKYSSTQIKHLNDMCSDLLECYYDPDNVSKATVDKRFQDPFDEKAFIKNFDDKNREFMWGIAIHCATDAYAHSAFLWDDEMNCYRKLTHTDNSGTNLLGADNPFYAYSRWVSAEETAEKMLAIYTYNSLAKIAGTSCKYATYDIFVHDKYFAYKEYDSRWDYPYFNKQFKMNALSQYAGNTAPVYSLSASNKLSKVSYYPYMENKNPNGTK